MKKFYPILGIIAPVFYILAVIIGGVLIEGYSHIYNTVSELTASNAPRIPIVQILFILYNLSLILLAHGMFLHLETPFRKKIKLAAVILSGVGLLGIGMYFFPQDPRGAEMTFSGKMHLILAGICSLFTMICVVLSGMGFNSDPKLKKLKFYSYVSVVFIFITGGLAAVSVANNAPFGGLLERLTIGGFIQWILVISLKLFQSNREEAILNEPLSGNNKGL